MKACKSTFGPPKLGTSWFDIYDAPADSGLPALAVNSNGTLGLLYTTYNSENNLLMTNFREFAVNFTGESTTYSKKIVLSTFSNGAPIHDLDTPYIGDYEGLVANGTKFYGTFSASNKPDPGAFPQGVFYQRYVRIRRGFSTLVKSNFSLTTVGTLSKADGTAVNVSIDPFFFSARDQLS
jgi:hypothetical protein